MKYLTGKESLWIFTSHLCTFSPRATNNSMGKKCSRMYVLLCFILEIETSNPAKRRHLFTDNAGDQQRSEKDTNGKIQVQATKYREQAAIRNT